MTPLNKDELLLLEWLAIEPGQYGECYGRTLESLIDKGFAEVGNEESGTNNNFIAKGTDIMYRSVYITNAGRLYLIGKR